MLWLRVLAVVTGWLWVLFLLIGVGLDLLLLNLFCWCGMFMFGVCVLTEFPVALF